MILFFRFFVFKRKKVNFKLLKFILNELGLSKRNFI